MFSVVRVQRRGDAQMRCIVVEDKQEAKRLAEELTSEGWLTSTADVKPRHAKTGIGKVYPSRMDQVKALLNDSVFKEACHLASIQQTTRQAHKWLRGKGAAYTHRLKAVSNMRLANPNGGQGE